MPFMPKFTVVACTQTVGGPHSSTPPGALRIEYKVELQPTRKKYGESANENDEYWHRVPEGRLEITGLREDVAKLFEIGKDYYIEFHSEDRVIGMRKFLTGESETEG